MHTSRVVRLSTGFAVAWLLTSVTTTSAIGANSCNSLRSFSLPPFALSIRKAEHLPAGPPPRFPFTPPFEGTLPPRCEVTGVIDQRVGVGGKPFAIEFAVALPDDWNGRFAFQGGGGGNGTLYPPLGFYATGRELAVERGFAVASTDSGHKGEVFDFSFFADQEAALSGDEIVQRDACDVNGALQRLIFTDRARGDIVQVSRHRQSPRGREGRCRSFSMRTGLERRRRKRPASAS